MPPTTLIAALAGQAGETSGGSEARLLSGTVDEILTSASTLRVNSQVALALAERVREMSNVISSIVLDAEGDDYDVRQLEAFATFKHALEEIQLAVRAQKERSYFSALLHQQRDRNALSALSDKLHAAFDILMTSMRIHAAAAVSARAADLDALAAKREAQLRAISALPTPAYAPIPPAPQLQFGRANETRAVVDALTNEDHAGRTAILGGPGIGKTTLAAAALHHPAVAERFGTRRFFVPCDAAEGRASCLTVITDAFGIVATAPSAALKGLERVLGGEPAVLVLDNFESAWEGAEQRAAAEEVLAFLDGLKQLSVIVTMRGSERPQGMQWTRPFLDPLSPLSQSAAKQVFLSIANVDELDPDVDALLERLDNMPLALVLMANLAQYTPLPALLAQWDESATAMLVRGATSLDVSIDMSLRSPRMQAVPDAQTLLSILALLPAGAMDTDVQTWSSELSPRALGVLLLTALATRTADGRVHVLAPIRSFMWSNYRPSGDCVTSVVRFYLDLAGLASTAALNPESLALISPELANIDSVIRFVLLAEIESAIDVTLICAALSAVGHLNRLHTIIHCTSA